MAGFGSAFQIALTLKAYDEASRVIKAMTDNAGRNLVAMQAKIRAASETLTGFGKASMLTGVAAGAAMALPIKAFADLENAEADLMATTLKAGGVVSAHLGQVNALAIRLGTELPGTTTDLSRMLNTMLRLGVTEQSVLSGVGEAAAKLSLVIRVPYEQGAAAAVQLKEATGVADAQFVQFMDSIQRAVTLGVGLDELSFAFGRSTGALKTLNLQGLQSANDLNVLFAILVKILKSGERAGTNFSVLMNTIADKKKLGEANAQLARYGITLDLFDRQTQQFKGVENLFAQFGQLKSLKPLELQEVLKALFGGGLDAQEAGLIVQQGAEGFRAMQARMQEQANLTEKSAVILGTTTNLWDAAIGTFTNAQATFAKAFAPELKFVIGLFGSFSERLANFAERHRILAKIVGLSTLGFAGLAIGVGSAALAVGMLLKGVDQAISGWQSLGKMIGWTRAGIQALTTVSAASRLRYLGIVPEAPTFFGRVAQGLSILRIQTVQWTTAQWASASATIFNAQWLRTQATLMATTVWSATVDATKATWRFVTAQWASMRASIAAAGGLSTMALGGLAATIAGLKAATAAGYAFSKALLFTPHGRILLMLGLLALNIITYWRRLAAFFAGLFEGISEGWNRIAQQSLVLRIIGTTVWVILTPLRWLWQILTGIFGAADDAGDAATAMVERWRAAGKMIGDWIGGLMATITNIPWILAKEWYNAGRNLVEMLWNGIMSMAHKPIQAMRDVATSIRNLLPFSPAKEGPLKTLHQIRLVETIAESIRPAPLVSKMRQTAAAVALSVPLAVTPALVAAAGQPSPSTGAGRTADLGALAFAGAGGINITTHITINGAEIGSNPQAIAQRIARENSFEVEKMLRRKYSA